MTTDKIREALPGAVILENEPMKRHTSFRIGGPADAYIIVNNEEELGALLRICEEDQARHLIVGNGSNFLVSDDGYRGIMIRLGGEFENACQSEDDETVVTAGAAKSLAGLSAYLTERGLSGFEFASGIPGSVGGAVFMNAGAYGGEIKDAAISVRLMSPDGACVSEVPAECMEFGYRHSRLEETGEIVLSCTMRFAKEEPVTIADRVAELQAKRNSKQPVNFPSAGSTFKRPAGGFAAALIDEAGLKGFRIGGAEVSSKHAGFVINTGDATAEDVLAVMRHVREEVYKNSGIMLEPEVRLIDCEL